MNLVIPKITREYRPELNGLRALAVVLVLFYHLNYSWMQGGFLGVDVFLVISGYFISRNILYDLQEGNFTFYRFYTKRLRRLFPALIFTLAVVLGAGYFLLAPSNYERLGLSTFFSSVSLSNFFFWGEAGYFDQDSGTKPLLHMWSLSLEEQFYLFWPLLLFLLHKFTRKHILLFVGIFIIGSVLFAELYYEQDPSAVFFLIPFRMFEFLLGASCIWFERFFRKSPRALLEALFVIGLCLIIFSGIEFDHFTRMPGTLSMVPCLGSVFVILGGKAPFTSWILKNKAVELIGKSSYSIYLIHWPLIVFYRYWRMSELSGNTQIKLAVVSIVLGLLMWYFIENTFRYSPFKGKKLDKIWIGIPSLIIVLSLFSYWIWNSNGAPDRFKGALYMTKDEILQNREHYFDQYRNNADWLFGDPTMGHIMVMGNSHSIDLIYALRQNGYTGRVTSLQSLGKCYNFGENYKENAFEKCRDKKEENLNDENWKLVDAIYLHDNWPEIDLVGFRNIVRRIRSISNAPIFIFGPKMTYQNPVPDIIWSSHSKSYEGINNHARMFSLIDLKKSINDHLLNELQHSFYLKNKIFYIDILSLQGTVSLDEFEIVSKDSLDFLYFDSGHLTQKGSKELGRRIKLKHPYLFEMTGMKEKYPHTQK